LSKRCTLGAGARLKLKLGERCVNAEVKLELAEAQVKVTQVSQLNSQ